MRSHAFAAIDRIEIVEDEVANGLITGLASPAGGGRPCGLALMAGAAMTACAAAAEFSRDARARGIRLGWCGFTIGGLGQAAALADSVELRCIVSNRVVMRWDSTALALRLAVPRRRHLSVEAMLGQLNGKTAIDDVEQVIPFALGLARAKGAPALIDAMFRYLLQRTPEVTAQKALIRDYNTAESIRELWRFIVRSDEYLRRESSLCSGPFDPEFPFLRDVLDHTPEPSLSSLTQRDGI